MKRFKLGLAVVSASAFAFLGITVSSTHECAAESQKDGSDKILLSSVNNPSPPAPQQINTSTNHGEGLAMNPSARDQGSCAEGMVEVTGDYCRQVEQKCLRWLDPSTKMRCAEFEQSGECRGPTVRKHFCVDRFEYPNRAGEKPVVMKTWYEARDACVAEGKRLCGDSEWTLACEGQERLPYPYGRVRDKESCNIDKPHPDADESAFWDPRRRDAEVARLDQRESSGSRDACVSPFGVHDMTGNVDEWVMNESGHPYKSGLKGGYWGPVRTRCRPMTTAHYEQFAYYQVGFRCCSDAKGSPTTKESGHSAKTRAPSPKVGAGQNTPVTGS